MRSIPSFATIQRRSLCSNDFGVLAPAQGKLHVADRGHRIAQRRSVALTISTRAVLYAATHAAEAMRFSCHKLSRDKYVIIRGGCLRAASFVLPRLLPANNGFRGLAVEFKTGELLDSPQSALAPSPENSHCVGSGQPSSWQVCFLSLFSQ